MAEPTASPVDTAPAGAETPINAASPAFTGTDALRTVAEVGRSIVAALQPVVAVEAIQLIEVGVQRAYDALCAVIAVPVYDYRVVNVYPHDPEAFTQGLVFQDGILYEGTGLWGESTLRKVDLESGEILKLY